MFVLFLAASIVSCAPKPHPDEAVILNRAEEFVEALSRNDFGKWWDMMVPADKNFHTSGADNREDYINVWRKASESMIVIDYDPAVIVAIGNNSAVTSSRVNYHVQEEHGKRFVAGCERTVWVKLSDGWYWHKTGLDCEYIPSARDLENLTGDLR